MMSTSPLHSALSAASELVCCVGLALVAFNGGRPQQQQVATDWCQVLAVTALAIKAVVSVAARRHRHGWRPDAPADEHYERIRKNQKSSPPPPPPATLDAASVRYRPFSPGLAGIAPLRAASTVADKLDTALSVLDFVPPQHHAAIRGNKQLGQGNVDLTRWFQAAIDFTDYSKTPQTGGSLVVLHIPYGRYYVGNLVLHDSLFLKGEHVNSTMLCPMPGTKGSWLKNAGNAGKISIMDIRFDGGQHSPASAGITAAIDLGTTGGGNAEWGTYSYMTNVYVSNFVNGVGIKLAVNVSVLFNVWTEATQDGILNEDGGCCLMAFGCGVMAFTGTGIRLQIADYWSGVEVEAPLDGSTPVEIHGAGTIDGILIGPPNSLVNGKPSHYTTLIKVDTAAAGEWGPGWHGGQPAHASSGWAVNGLVVDNSGGYGSWDATITVDGEPVEASFSNTSTLTVGKCMRFGDGFTVGGKDKPPPNSLFLDPTSDKLCYKDKQGVAHALY